MTPEKILVGEKKIVLTRNGFLSTDYFAKQTKFGIVRTGPYIISVIYIKVNFEY